MSSSIVHRSTEGRREESSPFFCVWILLISCIDRTKTRRRLDCLTTSSRKITTSSRKTEKRKERYKAIPVLPSQAMDRPAKQQRPGSYPTIFLAYRSVSGGLGFRKFSCFNQALLAKQGWRLVHNPESFFGIQDFQSSVFPQR